MLTRRSITVRLNERKNFLQLFSWRITTFWSWSKSFGIFLMKDCDWSNQCFTAFSTVDKLTWQFLFWPMLTSIAGGINLFGWYTLLYRAIYFISANKRFKTEMPNQIIAKCHFLQRLLFVNFYSSNLTVLFYWYYHLPRVLINTKINRESVELILSVDIQMWFDPEKEIAM